MDTLTIGDLARVAGVPTSTIRYYERAGLIRPERRSRANYRLYGAAALDRLRFIRSSQAAGFALAEIKSLLELRDGNMKRCDELRPLVEVRLAIIESRTHELKRIQRLLRHYLTTELAA